MTSTFRLAEVDALVDATSVIAGTYDESFDLKFSPTMFSLMVPALISSNCIISLQLSPEFFHTYLCNRVEYRWIPIQDFYDMTKAFRRMGLCSLTFCLPTPHRAQFKFQDPNGRSQKVDAPAFRQHKFTDVGEFDWGSFVSIASEDFINIITEFKEFDKVLVTLSNSQVQFSYARTNITILTHQRRPCIIGGVEPRNRIIFTIPVKPTVTFCNLACRSQRVWIFKSSNSLRGVIAAPLGLYARFLAYVPDDIDSSLQNC